MNFLSMLISPITGYFTKKNDNKTKIKAKQIDRLISADDKMAEWENIQAEGGRHSWKDEYWTVLLSIPVMGGFVGFEEQVVAGFAALALMPDFYQYWLGVAILSSFGVRLAKR